jgi:hypothetical protein
MTDDLVKRLRRNLASGLSASIGDTKDAADRIEQLEAEVLRLGDVLDATPSVFLQWPHEGGGPTIDFVMELMRKITKTAHEAIRGSLYHQLYDTRAMMEKKHD